MNEKKMQREGPLVAPGCLLASLQREGPLVAPAAYLRACSVRDWKGARSALRGKRSGTGNGGGGRNPGKPGFGWRACEPDKSHPDKKIQRKGFSATVFKLDCLN